MILFLLHALISPIQVKANEYTLRELGAVLSRQGCPTEVAAACADDVFAVRAKSASREDIFAALQATGRVQAVTRNNGWVLKRPDSFSERNRLLDRYTIATFEADRRVRTRAAAVIRQYWKETQDVRDIVGQKLDANAASDPEGKIVGGYIEGSYDPAYEPMMFGAELEGQGRAGIGTMQWLKVADRPALFFPSPDRSGSVAFDPKGPYGPVPDIAAGMLVWDPISDAAFIQVVHGNSSPLNTGRSLDWAEVRTPPSMANSPDSVLTKPLLAQYRARVSATSAALAKESLAAMADLPGGSIRLSSLLLTLADKTNQDLVYYVSPFSDRKIFAATSESIPSAVTKAAQEVFDVKWDVLVRRERTPMGGRFLTTQKHWVPYSAQLCGNTLAVRTETDFLDQLLDGPAGLPTSLENAAREGKNPTFDEIVNIVAGLKLSAWKGNEFSSSFLEYTNPLTFYPVAKAMQASKAFQDSIRDMKIGDTLEFPYKNMARPVHDAFAAGMMLAGPKCSQHPALDYLVPGVSAANLARGDLDNRSESLKLTVTRDKDGYTFKLTDGPLGFWHCWLQNVA